MRLTRVNMWLMKTGARSAFVIFLVLQVASAQSSAAPPSSADANRLPGLIHSVQLALEREDWLTAAHIATEAHEIQSGSGRLAFTAACAYARAQRDDEALAWLTTAAGEGYSNAQYLERSSCFADLRDHEGYISAREEIWQARDERFDRFVELAQNAETLVYVPRGLDADTSAPLLVVLHGRGGRGAAIGRAWRHAAENMKLVLVAPDSLHLLGAGYQWTYLDEAEYVVDQAIKAAAARHPIDESNIILSGFSQGASIALQLGLQHPERFPSVISWAGPWDVSMLPMGFVDKADNADERMNQRVYLLVGTQDRLAHESAEAYRALKEYGVSCELRTLNGLGHAIPRNPLKTELRALRFVMRE